MLLTVTRFFHRRGFWIAFSVFVPIGSLLAVYLYSMHLSDRRLAEVMAETAATDPRWRFWEIEADRKQYADSENGALSAIELRSKLPRNWLAGPKPVNGTMTGGYGATGDKDLTAYILDTPPERQLDVWQLGALRKNLDAVSEARKLARALVQYPGGRIPVKWSPDIFSTLLPNIQEMREVGNLLRLDAALLAEEGDGDGALNSARGIIHVGRFIGDEQLLISQLVRIALRAIAVKSVERTLAQTEPSEAALQELQRLLEEEAKDPVVLYGMRGERAAYHEMMELIREGKLNPSTFGGGPPQLGFLLAMTSRSSHLYGLRYYQKLFAIMKLPLHEQQPELDRLETELKQSAPPIARMLLPAVQRCIHAYRRSRATMDCSAVMVALERHRREKGGWPDSLDALVPKYLQVIPTDPFDGRPIRMRRLEDGLAIYTVGEDRTDNNGNLDQLGTMKVGTDWGYRLWDAKSRRQQPLNPEIGPPAAPPDKQ